MAKLNYLGCSFRYYWRDVSPESLRDYARRLEKVFNQGRPNGFSSDHFLSTFKNQLEHYDPHGNIAYEFKFKGDSALETWQIKIRVTQIPHVEGGVVQEAPHVERRLGFAHSLIENGVANKVEISELVQAKGFRRLLGKDLSGTLVGKPVYLYLQRRLFRIPSLNMKLRWEPLNASSFDFDTFADRVAGALESTHSDVVELHYGPETDDVPSFMNQCDERLKSQLDREELRRLFDLIELPPKEWFAS